MKHLSETEIVDVIDGALAPARAAHLDACDACRTKADELRGVLERTADVAMPEPSPLFWEHFSTRVHQEIQAANAVRPSGWLGWADRPTVTWAMAGALLTILLVSGVWVSLWRTSAVPSRIPPVSTASAGDRHEAASGEFDADTDEAWALVRTVADDLAWDDAVEEGLGVRPDAAERAIATLTRDERSELVRLLEAETKQPGA